MAVFPLFPEAATQTVAVDADAQVIEITGRVVTINVADDVDGIATLSRDLPVGLLFQLVAGTFGGSTTNAVITSASGDQTETLDATSEAVTLMILPEGDFTVVAPLVADTSS